MSSVRELARYIGRPALFSTVEKSDVSFMVKVKDAREAYGRINLLVVPDKGTGETWVNVESLRFTDVSEGDGRPH